MRSPALTTASGKAYLAFCADQAVVDRVSAPLIDDAADHFRDELAHVRAVGRRDGHGGLLPGHPRRREPRPLGRPRRARRDLDRRVRAERWIPDRVAPLVRAAGADRQPSTHGGVETMRTADWTDSVSVLDRVTAVFDAFGEQDDGLGVSELARRANLPKSTVSRIAADLVAQRFLDRDGDKLYLGVRLFELARPSSSREGCASSRSR